MKRPFALRDGDIAILKEIYEEQGKIAAIRKLYEITPNARLTVTKKTIENLAYKDNWVRAF